MLAALAGSVAGVLLAFVLLGIVFPLTCYGIYAMEAAAERLADMVHGLVHRLKRTRRARVIGRSAIAGEAIPAFTLCYIRDGKVYACEGVEGDDVV